MDYCPLCGKKELPEISVPGIQLIDGNLIYQHNFICALPAKTTDGICRQRRLLEIALRWWPGYVSTERCIFYIWQGDEPETALRAIYVMACQIRKRLIPKGFDFRGQRGLGYKFYTSNELDKLNFTKGACRTTAEFRGVHHG